MAPTQQRGLSRLHYFVLALPLAAVLYSPFSIGFSVWFAHWQALGSEDLVTVTWVMHLARYLLVFPLMWVVAARLRRVGGLVWLVLPMAIPVLIRYYYNWNLLVPDLQVVEIPGGDLVMKLTWAYSLLLLAVVLVWPGRKTPVSSPAAAVA